MAASVAEPACFALIFDRHYEVIWSYLGRRVGAGLAEELASETFALAFARRDTYDLGYEDARPWLYGIATNLVRRHVRSEDRRRRAYARALEHEEFGGGIDGALERVDAARAGRAVADALSQLTARDRETLLLFALTELDYAGIAVAMEVPAGTVRSRLHRVRRQLRDALSRDCACSPDPEKEPV